MNIAEILKDCPSGTRLYSPIYGELSLVNAVPGHIYPICCRTRRGNAVDFTEDGLLNTTDAEPTLFPSKEQRDWSKFVVIEQDTNTRPKHQFKPFDRVLARDSDDEFWFSEQFGHIDSDGTFICCGKKYSQCIPYEGNEHLLDTTNKPQVNNGTN